MSSRYYTGRRNSDSAGSDDSYDSRHSRSTAPTVYSIKPSLRHFDTDISQLKLTKAWADCFSDRDDDTHSIAESFASTVASVEDLDDSLDYQVPPDTHDYETYDYIPTAYPSTPEEFAQLFPSARRLYIHHDDTADGNMNLRLDTETRTQDGRPIDLTLFHLRMQDLKKREFSFRRYCRDSGREICHSSRKYAKPAVQRRPAIQRSVSNALASLKSMTSDRSSIKPMKRHDSGYGSMLGDDGSEDDSFMSSAKDIPIPTNTTLLEFSNYAHVELKRRGAKSSKRYDFDYWGKSYTWKRTVRKCGSKKEISYHLYSSSSSEAVAHIVPEPMSPYEQEEEERKGGWIAPSSMWISDSRILNAANDIADVIVATGLLAFVDDCIKNKWHRKDRFQFPIITPTSEKKLGLEYIGPKRLIDGIFNRGTV